MNSLSTFNKEYSSTKQFDKKFIIRSLATADIDEVANLVADVHFTCHPVIINLPETELVLEKLAEIRKYVIESIVDQDLSIVAVDQNNDKIVGFMGSFDRVKPPATMKSSIPNPQAEAVWECVDIFTKKYPEFYNVTEEKKLGHICFLVVHMEYQGLGLATEIMKSVNEHPKLLEFEKLEGDAASAFSLSVMKKVGFEVFDAIEFEKMQTSTGIYPLKDIREALKKKNLSPDHLHWTAMVLDRTKRRTVNTSEES